LAAALSTGDRTPLIAVSDQDGIERRSDQLGGKALVLFFYPKDDTPGCTMEACAFRDSYADLQAFGVPSVLGLLPGRVTYVIDGQGIIRHVFNNLLDGPAHRREAIDALRQLQAP
jgi:peroxiredoxin Q/BCP